MFPVFFTFLKLAIVFHRDDDDDDDDDSDVHVEQTHCSRYVHGHMKHHGTETGHSMVLSFADISVWCYICDAYVHHHVSGICVSVHTCNF